MHIIFIKKYQTNFTKSIDKTYIHIFLKHGLLNFHGTIPYLSPAAGFQKSQADPLHLSSLDYPKSSIRAKLTLT
jgi:hypothetical protein